MDHVDDSLVLVACELLELLNHDLRGVGIESGGGFVQKEDWGVRDQFKANIDPFPLSSGNALHDGASDVRVLGALELELVDHAGNPLSPV